jgi:predicted ATP-dependent endonuclease of OLD family
MKKVADDIWEDIRDGEILDTDELVGRFGVRRGALKERRVLPDWLMELMGSVKVRLIETQRLILQKKVVRHAPSRNRQPSTSTITDYAQQLSGKIQTSFNEYARLSQQLDQTFVVRLLKHDFTVEDVLPGNSVSVKVESLNQKRRRLRDSGLLSKEDEPLPLPEEATPLIDQILSAYLQDVESKLAVFDTLLGKIELLKSIVDAHLEYKTMVISQQSGFYFRAKFEKASRILPASLSSGEQHILILFYDLLFNDSENSLILIDEPEISLHVDWQLSFLDDLRRIVSIAPHDILLATHSPQIINNDWDLTVSLSRPEDPGGR